MNTEFLELVKDLKEQVQYLSELGVDKLDADLSDITLNSSPALQNQTPQPAQNISRERLEKFVPSDEILKKITADSKDRSVNADNKKTTRRSGLLNSSRLSDMPNIPTRDFGDRPYLGSKNDKKKDNQGKKKL